MARPYAHWKPSANAALHVRPADGPLVLTAADADLLKLAVSPPAEPLMGFLGDNYVWFAQAIRALSAGLEVAGYEMLPTGLTYLVVDPVNGSPWPHDVDDVIGAKYLSYGMRCTLRGWIGSVSENGLTGEMIVEWQDGDFRIGADDRGAWTGVVVFSYDGERRRADQQVASMHGKRYGDHPNWWWYGNHADNPAGGAGTQTAAASADTDAGQVRVVLTGASPLWTLNAERWDGAAWVLVHSVAVDLRANGVPGSLTGYGLVGAVVSSAVRARPPGAWPPVAPYPTQEVTFPQISVSQFEPWVPDIAEWSMLDWGVYLKTMLPGVALLASPELRRAPMDLLHMPLGHASAPNELRVADDDLGICMRLTKDTTLWAEGRALLPMVVVVLADEIATCSNGLGGFTYEAPFAVVVEIKPENMIGWMTDRWIVRIDDPLTGAPAAADNGMGIFWRASDSKLVARAYLDGTGWVDLDCDFPAATWEGRAVTIAACWSGNQVAGVSPAGRPDYEWRLVVDGVTRDSQVLDINFRLQGIAPPSIVFGAGGGVDGFQGLFGQAALFCAVMGDDDVRAAFEPAQIDFENADFEDAAESLRAGEAAHWAWRSMQLYNAFAEFNAYDAALEEHQGGFEGFEGGWLNDDWIADLADAVLVAAWFNATASHPWRLEDFAINWGIDAYTLTFDAAGYNACIETDIGLPVLGATSGNVGVLLSYDNGTRTWMVAHEAAFADMDLSGRAPPPPANFDFYTAESVSIVGGVGSGTKPTPGVREPAPGLPWKDVWTSITPPTEPAGATGWTSAIDAALGGHAYPALMDSFDEAWGGDPLWSPSGIKWTADAAQNGILRSGALALPVHVTDAHRDLWLVISPGTVYRLRMSVGVYTTAAALAVDLNTQLVAAGVFSGFQFDVWTDGALYGLTFGRDPALHGVTKAVFFGDPEIDPSTSLRQTLGFAARGPYGRQGRVRYPVAAMATPPAGLSALDAFIMDPWIMVKFRALNDPNLGGWFAVEDGRGIAEFDTAVSEDTFVELCSMHGWYGPTAVWVTAYGPGDLTAALFIEWVAPFTIPMEMFNDTAWPTEIFPNAH